MAMTKQGGFPINIFCNQAKCEPFQCHVCMEVCRLPVTCPSGAHLFCHSCLTDCLRHAHCCPVCRDPTTVPSSSSFAAAQVSALDVVCVHKACNWKGTCGRLDRHLDTECSYEPIPCAKDGCEALVPRGEMATHEQFVCLQSCPNSKSKSSSNKEDTCDVRLSRNDLADHLKDHCKLREIHCPHPSCQFITRYNRMPAHLEECPHAPLPCPRKCGANVIRQSLEAHKKDCPNEPVACVHAPMGCSYVAPRCEIAQHEQDVPLHFSITRSKAFAEQQEAYQQKMEKMEQTFLKRLEHHEKIMEQQTALLTKLEKQNAMLSKKVEDQSAALNSTQFNLLFQMQEQIALVIKKVEDQSVATQNSLSKKLDDQSAVLSKKMEDQRNVLLQRIRGY